jgi:hypothetical protein
MKLTLIENSACLALPIKNTFDDIAIDSLGE